VGLIGLYISFALYASAILTKLAVLADKVDMMSHTEFTANQFLDTEIGPGIPPVLALFESAGLEGPSYDTVRKWRARDSMPAYWLAKTLYALECVDGRTLSMGQYFKQGGSRCSNAKRSSSGSPLSVFD
jgi:hypothetical protein